MREISAGGVVFRREGGQLRFLLIEDRYGKWTLPKGKQEPGETLEQTALREVREETGVAGTIVQPLATIGYTYHHPVAQETVDKEVHYYLIEALTAELTAQIEEIHEVHWVTAEEAWQRQRENGYGNNDSIWTKAFAHLGIEV